MNARAVAATRIVPEKERVRQRRLNKGWVVVGAPVVVDVMLAEALVCDKDLEAMPPISRTYTYPCIEDSVQRSTHTASVWEQNKRKNTESVVDCIVGEPFGFNAFAHEIRGSDNTSRQSIQRTLYSNKERLCDNTKNGPF